MGVLEREQALAAATRLVDEIIMEAEAEANRRRKESAAAAGKKTPEEDTFEGGIQALMKRGTRLQTRAKGFVTRLLTQLRICK